MSSRVALLGVGAMGRPMATVLYQHGIGTTVFDPDEEQTRELATLGLRCAPSAAEAVRDANVVLVMVATAAQVEASIFGSFGAIETMPTGTTVVVMSTIGADAIRSLADRLSETGMHVVDAPVSGGVARATTGSLLIMVGASDGSFSRAQPVLETLGDPVVRVGDQPGDGQNVKLVNQLLCGVHIAAAAEALALASNLGLDAERVWDVVRTGAAASFMLDDRGGRMARQQFEPVNSAVQIFTKDLGLVTEAAAGHHFTTPLATTAHNMFSAAARDGLARHDDSELYRHLLDRTPVTP